MPQCPLGSSGRSSDLSQGCKRAAASETEPKRTAQGPGFKSRLRCLPAPGRLSLGLFTGRCTGSSGYWVGGRSANERPRCGGAGHTVPALRPEGLVPTTATVCLSCPCVPVAVCLPGRPGTFLGLGVLTGKLGLRTKPQAGAGLRGRACLAPARRGFESQCHKT